MRCNVSQEEPKPPSVRATSCVWRVWTWTWRRCWPSKTAGAGGRPAKPQGSGHALGGGGHALGGGAADAEWKLGISGKMLWAGGVLMGAGLALVCAGALVC